MKGIIRTIIMLIITTIASAIIANITKIDEIFITTIAITIPIISAISATFFKIKNEEDEMILSRSLAIMTLTILVPIAFTQNIFYLASIPTVICYYTATK